MSLLEQSPIAPMPEAIEPADMQVFELEWNVEQLPTDPSELVLSWQEPLKQDTLHTIDQAQEDRERANMFTRLRCKAAPLIGNLIVAAADTVVGRVVTGAALALAWYTDHLDGKLARRSFSRLTQLCEEYPAVAGHPQVKYLLSPETRAKGAEDDHKADKETANIITEALTARAIAEEDIISATYLGVTAALTQKRDPLMAELRAKGHEQGVQVGAKIFGKVKTTMLATGQGLMATSKKGSRTHHIGLGLVVGSNAPSWAAVYHMDRHIKRETKS